MIVVPLSIIVSKDETTALEELTLMLALVSCQNVGCDEEWEDENEEEEEVFDYCVILY